MRSARRSLTSGLTASLFGAEGSLAQPLPVLPTSSSLDPDATAYIANVETADGQSLEEDIKTAINNFFVSAKANGYFSAIKTGCILAGAKTLSGALTPLISGNTPTSFNFVGGDYDRINGLSGDGSKYINTGRSTSADALNNIHMSVWAHTRDNGNNRYIDGDSDNLTIVGNNSTGFRARVGSGNLNTHGTLAAVPCLIGVSRNNSSSYDWRIGTESGTQSETSTSVNVSDYNIFSVSSGAFATSATIAFYSIGESLDLSLLSTDVNQLISDISAALTP